MVMEVAVERAAPVPAKRCKCFCRVNVARACFSGPQSGRRLHHIGFEFQIRKVRVSTKFVSIQRAQATGIEIPIIDHNGGGGDFGIEPRLTRESRRGHGREFVVRLQNDGQVVGVPQVLLPRDGNGLAIEIIGNRSGPSRGRAVPQQRRRW